MKDWHTNPKYLKVKEINSHDEYSKAVMIASEYIMKKLDNKNFELEIGMYPNSYTPHGMLCEHHLSGFQASVVICIIKKFHTRGKEFQTKYNLSLIQQYT